MVKLCLLDHFAISGIIGVAFRCGSLWSSSDGLGRGKVLAHLSRPLVFWWWFILFYPFSQPLADKSGKVDGLPFGFGSHFLI